MKKIITLVGLLIVANTVFAQSQNENDRADSKPYYAPGNSYIQVQADALMKYPEHALDAGIEGTVTVSFIVDEKGAIHDLKVTQPLEPGLDAEALRIVSLLTTDWVPGTHNGKKASMEYSLPITFDIQKYRHYHNTALGKSPQPYPGKMPSPAFDLNQFLMDNLVYPSKARDKNKEGRALVKFVVNEDGTISDVQIQKSAGNDDLDNEAMRVISKMPKWHPGIIDGQPVKVYFTLPVNFSLE